MVTPKKIRHRDAFRIGICFDYDGQLKQSTQRIGTRWSQTLQWYWVDYWSTNFKKNKPSFPKPEPSFPKLEPIFPKLKPTCPKLELTSHKLKSIFPKPEIAKYPNQEISHPVPGLQNSHGTIFIVDDKINNALLSHLGEEHQLEKPEPTGISAKFIYISGKCRVVKVPYSEYKYKAVTTL